MLKKKETEERKRLTKDIDFLLQGLPLRKLKIIREFIRGLRR